MNVLDFIKRMLAGDPHLKGMRPRRRKPHRTKVHQGRNAAQKRKIKRKMARMSRRRNRA